MHNPHAKTKKRFHNPCAKKTTTKMAKQEDETTNNSQSSSFHNYAPGFNFSPEEEMVFKEQSEVVVRDATEWAASTGLVARQDAVPLQIALPGVMTKKKLVSEPSGDYKGYDKKVSKVLSLDIATTRVKTMGNLAVASRLGPSSFRAIFPIGPPSAHACILPGPSYAPTQGPTQVPIAATNTSRSNGGRAKKLKRKQPPCMPSH
jgi:hypothetical protein